MPLVVDLDGTLVATDTLWELIVAFLKVNPLRIFQLVAWALSGKARFKEHLTSAAALDVESLPYRPECLAWLRTERAAGRKIYLATGADSQIASAVAAHLNLFDGVIASDGTTNATGTTKSDLIARLLGGQDFEYAGNAMVDVEVWRKSSGAVVVAPNRGVMHALQRDNIRVAQYFPARRAGFTTWLKAIRGYQWIKNVLIFAPLIMAHRIFDLTAVAQAALGFVTFSFAASSTYLINDLLDLPADRRHATKHKRPLASGSISIPSAIAAASFLLFAAAGLSFLLPPKAALVVFGYSAATLCYSAFLKRLLMVDVVTLALFYTARLLYGGQVTHIQISSWALAFCAFSFFSLAATKRINDVAKAQLQASESLRHRAYQARDLNALVSVAAATSNIAVLVLVFYINSQQGEKLYHHPQILWSMSVPLLYWFSRIVTLANRGALSDDPILFAAKDRATYIVLACMAAITIAAT